MKHNTLVILAGGLGSRFGGDKQISQVGPHGECLMEYSIYDAIEAGFDRVVFILKPDIHELSQARVLEWVAIFSIESSPTQGFLPPLCVGRRLLYC